VLPAAKNPVKKILLVVTGNKHEGEVLWDEVGTEQNQIGTEQKQMLRQMNERELLMADLVPA
jgi:hypothetical protein